MGDGRSRECRQPAAKCLDLARLTSDLNARTTSLVSMAQKWLELASHDFGSSRFNEIMQDFNDRQMTKNASWRPRLAAANDADQRRG